MQVGLPDDVFEHDVFEKEMSMKPFAGTVAALIVATCAAGLSAQQAGQQTAQPGKDELHVAGCVAAEAGKYMLQNATAVGVASRTRAMPNGPASAAEPDERRTYELTGLDLAAHVGHKVEIAGTLDDSKIRDRTQIGTTGTAAPAGTSATTGGSATSAAPDVLKVSSVKPIADSCS
jgi:hypothetical protein